MRFILKHNASDQYLRRMKNRLAKLVGLQEADEFRSEVAAMSSLMAMQDGELKAIKDPSFTVVKIEFHLLP